MQVTEHQWLLVGEMQAGILRAILGRFESLLGLEYKTMAIMEGYMLIKIIININEKTVTDDVDHSWESRSQGDEEVSSMPAGHSVWLHHRGRKGGWAGEGPLTDVAGWEAACVVFSSCCCPGPWWRTGLGEASCLQGCGCSRAEVCEGANLGLTHLPLLASSLP